MRLSIWSTIYMTGILLGLAVGDALGTPLEFKERDAYPPITTMRGGGPFNLAPGEWTDDTSMALALAQTLIDHGQNTIELLQNFTRWYINGDFSHNDKCFDIGATTASALRKFIKSDGTDDSPASSHFMDSGNGGIMRLAPIVIYASSHNEAVTLAEWQSHSTHASDLCIEYAKKLASDLWRLLDGEKPELVCDTYSTLQQTARNEISSSGFVVDTYNAAWWAIANTTTFTDALLLAVNLADDSDTVGAVTGQLAAAIYGADSIPTEWVDVLAWSDKIITMEKSLCR